MKKQIASVLAAAALMGCAVSASAADSAVQTVTDAMMSFETSVSFRSSDAVQTMLDVFDENPYLYYYFGGFDCDVSGKRNTMELKYTNTEVDPDSIFVVENSEDLYNVIGLALAETRTEVAMVITDSAITRENIVDTINQWKTDNYLVYMGYEGANADLANAEISTWTACTLTLSYMTDGTTVQAWRTQTENEVVNLCETLFAQDMPEYQKELLIHDYLIEHCSYEETADSEQQYTAYGCLVEGKAVCEGYAEAAYILFKAAGLECYYVEGAGTSADHAWNCVRVDGQYYWVDVTWDDPVPAEGSSEIVDHTYFNVTDGFLSADHSWQTAQYPSCTSTTWSYSACEEALASEEDTEAYTDYSTRNITLLDTVISNLSYSSGAEDASAADSDTAETADETAPAETDAAAEGEETSDADTDAGTKSGAGILRKVLITLLVIILLLVAAYLVWRRQQYIKAQERKKARREEERKRAEQKAREEAERRRREEESRRYSGYSYGRYGSYGSGSSYDSGSSYGSSGGYRSYYDSGSNYGGYSSQSGYGYGSGSYTSGYESARPAQQTQRTAPASDSRSARKTRPATGKSGSAKRPSSAKKADDKTIRQPKRGSGRTNPFR